MRRPKYLGKRVPQSATAPEKFSFKDGTVYLTTLYFISLAAGGVIFYQYFSSIHYLPTIEVSIIFWSVLFVFASGFVITVAACTVVLLPSYALFVIDWLLGHANKSARDALRKKLDKFSVINGLYLSIPWVIWPIYYYYYFRHPLDRLIYVGIFVTISIAGSFLLHPWLPKEVKKYCRLFVLYFIAVGAVVSLDYDISSFLFRKSVTELPLKNNVDTFLMVTALTCTVFTGIVLGKKTKAGIVAGTIIGTLSFLLIWESPSGNTLSKSIMTNFKLGNIDVSMTLNKDYVKSLKMNSSTSQLPLRRNEYSGKLLTRIGTEYVVEVKTCTSCHGSNRRNILSIPKDKVETFVILEKEKI